MQLVLVRHGETDWNAQGRMQGHSQTSINECGRMQAQTVGNALVNVGITKILSSDLLRAVQTAEIISELLHVPFATDARLREFCFGKMEGECSADIVSRNDAMKCAYESWNFSPYGGEDLVHVCARMNELLQELQEKHASDTVLLVSHGAFLYTLQKQYGLLVVNREGVRGIKRGEYQLVEFQNNNAKELAYWNFQNAAVKSFA